MSDMPSGQTPPVDTQDLHAAGADATAEITEPPYRRQDSAGAAAIGDFAFNAATYPDQATVHGPATVEGTELNSVNATAATGVCVPEGRSGLAATQPIEATGDFVLAEPRIFRPVTRSETQATPEPTIGRAPSRRGA